MLWVVQGAEDEKEEGSFWVRGVLMEGVFWAMEAENWQPACICGCPWEMLSCRSCAAGSHGGTEEVNGF